MSVTWPIAGFGEFLRHPRWWLAPLAANALGWAAMLGAGVGVAVWRWPHGTGGWWAASLAGLVAIGWAALAAAAIWLLVLPPLVSLACERLAKAVQRAAGAPPAREEPLPAAVWSSLRVVLGTLWLRLAWLIAALVGLLLGGVPGIAISALAVAHVALIDACDVGLAVRGLDGRARLAALRAHRGELAAALPAAAALQVALAATIVGLVFLLPGLVAGAATRVLAWPEARPAQAQKS